MTQNTNAALALAALLAAAPHAIAAGAAEDGPLGDPNAGKEKSAACAACHGADGNSTSPEWPKLAGQHPGYTAKQLHDFKSGARVNATMNGMAAGLSDQDIADLAAYYATQEVKLGGADPELVDAGEKLYRGGNSYNGVAACMGCHGPAGTGNPAAKFPSLSGQHAQYTAKALRDFRGGERANDPNEMMRRVAKRMSDREIEAVSEYIEGLHP